MYCRADGKIDAKSLPPYHNSLFHHTQRENYQAAILRKCLIIDPETTSRMNHGWTKYENGNLSIKLTSLKSAPKEILELLSCHCKRKYVQEICPCWKCTDTCHTFECDNERVIHEEEY